jgi:hypothetical protein
MQVTTMIVSSLTHLCEKGKKESQVMGGALPNSTDDQGHTYTFLNCCSQ